MAIKDNIIERLDREPFEPFRIVASSGEFYTVHNPHLIAVMRSELFIAQPNSDRRAYVPPGPRDRGGDA